jgi:BioD-like phosphotransacetylase family protein
MQPKTANMAKVTSRLCDKFKADRTCSYRYICINVKQGYSNISKTDRNVVTERELYECLPPKLNCRGRSVTVQSKNSVLASEMELERNSKATVRKSRDPAAIGLE